ncbi:universal stress protein [Natronorarus salvus]|uniref:universal stress protein n=1 Tax=Natronorarus salvus TaxID=3117733 RepID=UPI002F25FD0D
MPIVAAVDESERAGPIVEEAARLGAAMELPVHVIHVLTREGFVELEQTSVTRSNGPVPMEDVIEGATAVARRAAEEAHADATAVGLMGDPAEEVVTYADEHEAEYLVIAGRKRSPVGKALFGSVVQSMLLDAPCPVVSVRLD